uniref:Uncharacterized protein n=1 Tax=Marseillevirus LCMAC103 TaxID=2506604 RepID=A0A481YV14_9VIRU|nr:MAG: uncharacterized protein LCMAC103_00680 [Marseillevirus LCMAC103]
MVVGFSLQTETIAGALLVIAGVVVKNSEEQLKRPPTMLGSTMFLFGWALLAFTVANNRSNKGGAAWRVALPFVAAATIAGSVMAMKQAMGKGKDVPMYLPALFVAGWLLFAFSLNRNRVLAFGSAALVFASMLYFLPQQRIKCVVDGPGMVLFTLAWVGIVIANVGPGATRATRARK